MEQQIKMAAKLYRCRDTVKKFYGNEFKETIAPYQKCISGLAKEENIGELEAMMRICEDKELKEHGWTLVLIMAAAVELIEPSV